MVGISTVSNTQFKDINETGLSTINSFDGSAIYDYGTSEYYTVNVSGLGNIIPSFNNCRYGINLIGAGVTATDNLMVDINDVAIQCELTNLHVTQIENNVIETNHHGIHLNQIDGSFPLTIKDNIINVAT
jgi:hypothetical protein